LQGTFASADPQRGVLAHQSLEPAEVTAVPGIDEGPDDGLVGLEPSLVAFD
jgi:hypothetical protein